MKFETFYERPWALRRTCPFSLDVIKNFDTFHELPPEPVEIHTQMLFFSPKCNPHYTVGMIDGARTWYFWLGKRDPSMEILSLRFTHDMKREDAIRELAYTKDMEMIRLLRVMRGEVRGWDFFQHGKPQPFEEGKSYDKIKGKSIQEYFTFDDMLRFATNWGCPFGDANFWASDNEMVSFGKLPNDEVLADWRMITD